MPTNPQKKKSLYQILFENKGVILSLLFYFLLFRVIDRYIYQFLIDNVIIYFYGIYFELAIGVFTILLASIAIQNRKKTITWKSFSIVLLLSSIYLIHRLMGDYYFKGFSFAPWLKYMDLIIATITIVSANNYYNSCKKVTVKADLRKGLIEDLSIQTAGESNLDQNYYIEALYKKLIATQNKNAFVVGITGKWGSGKTSFSNMLKEKIKNENEGIFIELTSWQISSESIQETILNKLLANLKSTDLLLKHKLIQYRKVLSKKYGFIDSIIDKILNIDKDQLYTSICSESTSMKKHFVLIDDIDRLDKNEIKILFKLLRNHLNFGNFIYILCYDKTYVKNTLEIYNKKEYLEKIVQLEVRLPYYDKQKLLQILQKKIMEACPEDWKPYFTEWLGNRGRNFILAYVKTPREVIMLINQLLVNIEAVGITEIDIDDFVKVEFLKIKSPEVFDSIIQNQDRIFMDRIHASMRNRDQLTLIFSNGKVAADEIIKDSFALNILKDLFASENDNQRIAHNHRGKNTETSIIFIDNFNKYFSYRVEDNILPVREFQTYINESGSSVEKNREMAINWIKKNQGPDLLRKIEAIKNVKDISQFSRLACLMHFLHEFAFENGIDLSYNKTNFSYYNKEASFYTSLGSGNYQSILKHLISKIEGTKTYNYELVKDILFFYTENFVIEYIYFEQILMDYYQKLCNEQTRNSEAIRPCLNLSFLALAKRAKFHLSEKNTELFRKLTIQKAKDDYQWALAVFVQLKRPDITLDQFGKRVYGLNKETIRSIWENDYLAFKNFLLESTKQHIDPSEMTQFIDNSINSNFEKGFIISFEDKILKE